MNTPGSPGTTGADFWRNSEELRETVHRMAKTVERDALRIETRRAKTAGLVREHESLTRRGTLCIYGHFNCNKNH